MGGAIKSIGHALGGFLEKAVGVVAQMAMSYFTGGGLGSIFGELLGSVGGGAAKKAIGGIADNFMGQATDYLSQTGLSFVGNAMNQATNSGDVSDIVGSFTGSLSRNNTQGADVTGMVQQTLANTAAGAVAQFFA